MNDHPNFATNVFEEYQEPEPIRSEQKHTKLRLVIGLIIFIIGVAFNYHTLIP